MDITASDDWYNNNFRYLIQEVRNVRLLLERFIERQTNQLLTVPENQLASDTVFTSALDKLCAIFNLSLFERHILLLCVATELDPTFETLFTDASGNPKCTYPTLGLALAVLPGAHWSVLKPESPLHYWHLIGMVAGETLTKSPIGIDRSILCYLLGEASLSEKLEAIVKPIQIEKIAATKLQPSHEKIATQLLGIWLEPISASQVNAVQLCGIESAANINIAATVCYGAGCNLHIIKGHTLPTNPNDLNYLLRRWEREALLNNSTLLLDCHEVSVADGIILFAIKQVIENINSRLIIISRDRLPLSQDAFITFDVPKLTSAEQLAIWEDHLGARATELNGQVKALVSQFKLSQQAIRTACAGVLGTKNAFNHQSNDLGTALWDMCRNQARPQLDDLAQQMKADAVWDDLVLPQEQRQILRDMAAHVRQRMKVYETWGFASKGGRGLGISALFAGASGTGKTMSAEVVANELHLDLYRIDLSAVVSKYIGETEKNLRRIQRFSVECNTIEGGETPPLQAW